MQKNNKKILSLFLLLLGTALLSILLTYRAYDASTLNSTGFINHHNLLYTLRNYIADIMFQIFGIVAYFIPITLLFWSYNFYTLPTRYYNKYKFLATILFLIIAPEIVYNYYSHYQAGFMGAYLANTIIINQFSYIVIIGLILLAICSLDFTPRRIISIFLTIYFLIRLLIYKIINYITHKKYFSHTNHSSNTESNNISNNSVFKLIPDFNFLKSRHFKFGNLDKDDTAKEDLIQPESDDATANNTFISSINANQNNHEDRLDENSSSNLFNHHEQNYLPESIQNYNIPISFLNNKKAFSKVSNKELESNAINLEKILQEFNIKAKIVNIQTGPVVTLYEMVIPAGVKTSKVISLEADIALRMKVNAVRIAVVSGKDVLGVEIPNQKRAIVYLKETILSKEFQKTTAALPLILGHSINGKPIISDLSIMPHLLIAGTTGSGKSVGINAMILSLLYKLSPEQCKLIMIDPKMLELSMYQDIPHLITPVVTNPKQAITALKWVVKEMEYRYYQMSLFAVRNLANFNEKIQNKAFVQGVQQKILASSGNQIEFKHLPYIVVIIDEMADLMMVAGKEVESAVQRLAQMARASGIHLIMATQRPSVDVITGTIKANFSTRISFQVSSKIDSRTILGEQGAEQLLGKGDMLFMSGVSRMQRIHGPFISDNEVLSVVDYLKSLSNPNYIDNILQEDNSSLQKANNNDADELFDDAMALILQEQRASTSFLQRKFQIGYNRAARLIEQLEDAGVVSKATATGKREILIK